MREPRCCFRVGRPRVTCTPSRVQTITRSNTRSLRRCPPGLIRAEPACSVRWARSLRRTERPVHHGSSRGSLQSLAPTRTSPHSRVPTHNSATCSRVRCQHYRMRVVGNTLERSQCQLRGCRVASTVWTPLLAHVGIGGPSADNSLCAAYNSSAPHVLGPSIVVCCSCLHGVRCQGSSTAGMYLRAAARSFANAARSRFSGRVQLGACKAEAAENSCSYLHAG
jgi:hypothetical protein